ncbi:hypothetical protein [Methanobrevibacter sp. UBA188]|uniref:hypothetical protein n=1 Tax=Methanobrevibacter sp. UBA188 TaxID=1915473 RepID=UPI0025E3F9C9|nr:hypothetical protein [Methanobrevibacter sp. UBA188]
MKQIDNQKIRKYQECSADEKEVLDSFRRMKLMFDQARFELFSYKLTDLLEKYEDLLEMRQETQALLFTILDEIDQHGLAGIDIDYKKLGLNRQAEADNIREEVNIVKEYKVAFDEGLALISSGAAEQAILDAENCW